MRFESPPFQYPLYVPHRPFHIVSLPSAGSYLSLCLPHFYFSYIHSFPLPVDSPPSIFHPCVLSSHVTPPVPPRSTLRPGHQTKCSSYPLYHISVPIPMPITFQRPSPFFPYTIREIPLNITPSITAFIRTSFCISLHHPLVRLYKKFSLDVFGIF